MPAKREKARMVAKRRGNNKADRVKGEGCMVMSNATVGPRKLAERRHDTPGKGREADRPDVHTHTHTPLAEQSGL